MLTISIHPRIRTSAQHAAIPLPHPLLPPVRKGPVPTIPSVQGRCPTSAVHSYLIADHFGPSRLVPNNTATTAQIKAARFQVSQALTLRIAARFGQPWAAASSVVLPAYYLAPTELTLSGTHQNTLHGLLCRRRPWAVAWELASPE